MNPRSSSDRGWPSRSRRGLWVAALWLCAAFILGPSTFAVLPVPCCVFYGEARDAYGCPYLTNATVILRVEGTETCRWTINGMLAPGINFKLPVELDDGRGSSYAAYAARPGQTVRISLLAQGVEQPIVQTRVLTSGLAGEFLGVYVTAGTDADGDGLPDLWEQELLENADGRFTDIAQIRPEDDADGDGVSNWDEYRAGTYAFLADDFLAIEETARVANGRLRLRFLTSSGVTYQVLATDQLGPQANWQAVPLALTESGTAQYQALVGSGYYTSLFVELKEPRRFYKLVAQ
jgi:hypothetical protein